MHHAVADHGDAQCLGAEFAFVVVIPCRHGLEPLTPHTGALVHVDRAHLYDDDVVQACLAALEERGVLVFPKLGLDDTEQLAFTDKLGPRTNPTAFLAGGANAAA